MFSKTVTVGIGKKDRYGREVVAKLINGMDANLEQYSGLRLALQSL
jgi:endonuclease YncB( thermonuclease family)